jgi:hypothetical protein
VNLDEKIKNYFPYVWGSKTEAQVVSGYGEWWLKERRLSGPFIEGIHYVKPNSCTVRYNLILLEDYVRNSSNPARHQKAIERYLATIEPIRQRKTAKAPSTVGAA